MAPGFDFMLNGAPRLPLALAENARLSPRCWKYFWRLPLPHSVLTPWWRLFQDSIGNRSKLFKWSNSLVSSPMCLHCQIIEESLMHLFVECHFKWAVWQFALFQYAPDLPRTIITPSYIWNILTLHDTRVSIRLTLVIAAIFGGIWNAHWHCHFQAVPWSHPLVMGYISSNVSRLNFADG